MSIDCTTLAKTFHEQYERLAPHLDYKTRPDSAKPWEEVPDRNKVLMLATAQAVIDRLITPQADHRYNRALELVSRLDEALTMLIEASPGERDDIIVMAHHSRCEYGDIYNAAADHLEQTQAQTKVG